MGHVTAPTVDEAIAQRYDFYVSKSLYWENLQMYREWFDDSQIFVGFLEDLYADPGAFFATLTEFLGIGPAEEFLRVHQSKSEGKKVASPILNRLSKNLAVDMIKLLVPRKLKDFLRTEVLVQKALKTVTLWVQRPMTIVMEEMAEDSRQFFQFCQKPTDYWRL